MTLCRLLILLLLVAALPMRGYAAVAADLCSAHHGGAVSATVEGHDHDHGTDDYTALPDRERSTTASICSVCASCSVGTSLAPMPARMIAVAAAGSDRIPFLDVRKTGYVPDPLDHPPLVS